MKIYKEYEPDGLLEGSNIPHAFIRHNDMTWCRDSLDYKPEILSTSGLEDTTLGDLVHGAVFMFYRSLKRHGDGKDSIYDSAKLAPKFLEEYDPETPYSPRKELEN